MKAYERLLNYVAVDTPSDPESGKAPSSDCQFALAKMLVEELKGLGVENAEVDEKCYVYASIPATEGYENSKRLGFIAHMDTTPDFNGYGVKPQLISDYNGKDVVLGDSGRMLKVSDFPELAKLKGRTLITTDGTTLLGADDKAGVAEIMTLVERILNENIPHGKICIGFTPDEEVGAGADHFDVERFGADIAYTIDGGMEGEIEYENFNAAGAKVIFHGNNVHPGMAKNIMVNSQLVAMEFASMFPADETPATTEGYEGFFHLTDISGATGKTVIKYIIRDHDIDKFNEKKSRMKSICKKVMSDNPGVIIDADISDTYYNMIEKIIPDNTHIIDRCTGAMEKVGITPFTEPIRGGTDGATLSFMGLPCPNICSGGHNYHGVYEFICKESMEKITGLLIAIALCQ